MTNVSEYVKDLFLMQHKDSTGDLIEKHFGSGNYILPANNVQNEVQYNG